MQKMLRKRYNCTVAHENDVTTAPTYVYTSRESRRDGYTYKTAFPIRRLQTARLPKWDINCPIGSR